MNRKVQREHEITHFYEGLGISLGRLVSITQCRGRFRSIRIFRHPELGKVFVLGDEIQHVEAWAPLYHEPLVHLPASFIPEVKQVMILGGGTLFAAAEVLKYKSVKRVLVVDQDKRVAQTVRRHYAHAKRCFADRRFEFQEGDAYIPLAQLRDRFDLIINDGGDLLASRALGVTQDNSTRSLFSLMRRALNADGVCADVVYRHVFEETRTLQTLKLLSRGRVALSLVLLPEYHGVLHILFMWGKGTSGVTQHATQPTNLEQKRWARNPVRSPCVYYDPRFLPYYFYVPRWVKTSLRLKRKAV